LCKEKLFQFLKKYQLTVNQDKEKIFTPNEAYEFLGFKCNAGKIDLSDATKQKLKGKIRRKSHALFRWKTIKNADTVHTMQVLIKRFNRKFFETDNSDDLTWSRWFFPVINQSEGLREIDRYLQQNIRYLSTGKYNKTNFKVHYETLKKLGYRSLVNEFYRYKTELNINQ
jgi:hypothetical protein